MARHASRKKDDNDDDDDNDGGERAHDDNKRSADDEGEAQLLQTRQFLEFAETMAECSPLVPACFSAPHLLPRTKQQQQQQTPRSLPPSSAGLLLTEEEESGAGSGGGTGAEAMLDDLKYVAFIPPLVNRETVAVYFVRSAPNRATVDLFLRDIDLRAGVGAGARRRNDDDDDDGDQENANGAGGDSPRKAGQASGEQEEESLMIMSPTHHGLLDHDDARVVARLVKF